MVSFEIVDNQIRFKLIHDREFDLQIWQGWIWVNDVQKEAYPKPLKDFQSSATR